MIKSKNSWNTKLRKEKISNAISAKKLHDEGWSHGQLIDHFGVDSTTLKRWFKLVEDELS